MKLKKMRNLFELTKRYSQASMAAPRKWRGRCSIVILVTLELRLGNSGKKVVRILKLKDFEILAVNHYLVIQMAVKDSEMFEKAQRFKSYYG